MTTKPRTKSKKRPRRPHQKHASMSALDAAAKVLAETRGPLTCPVIVEAMLQRKYWKTAGKTPAATLHAAIQREIKTKKRQARFRKVGRGKFTLKG